MSFAVLFSSLLGFLLLSGQASAQFPWVCTSNATLVDAVCCPKSGPDDLVCGGPTRGRCAPVQGPRLKQTPRMPPNYQQDDRLEWPLKFFKFGCACNANFWGYACQRCRPGWSGPDCNRQQLVIRRDVFSLNAQQRRLFQDVISRAKTEPSDMAVLNITSPDNADPIDKLPQPPQFYNVTVYNFLIYLHVYASRSTLIPEVLESCLETDQLLDFGHQAPGFPAWHRYFLLVVETELNDIAQKYFDVTEPFTLPYWDWVGATNCTVCTNDIMGATNMSDPLFRLDRSCPFSNWTGFCDRNSGNDACHVCDPEKEQPFLWRVRSTQFENLTTQDDIDYLMDLKTFDVEPYDKTSNATSFRNVLEGFVDKRNNINDVNEGRPHLHNLMHSFMNGTWFDVSTSPNDPLFWLHHCFIDKLFELWIRRNKAGASVLPISPRPGHGRYDPLVPFFPVEILGDYMVDSRLLGYDYDNQLAGTFDLQAAVLADNNEATISWLQTWTVVEGAVLGAFILGVIIFVIVRWRRSRAKYSQLYEYVDTSTADESTPLMDDSQREQRQRQRRRKQKSTGSVESAVSADPAT